MSSLYAKIFNYNVDEIKVIDFFDKPNNGQHDIRGICHIFKSGY